MKAIPIKQGHKLGVSWPVTPSIHHYDEAPSQYLGHLIGHEGEGSLFHALKTLGMFSMGTHQVRSSVSFSYTLEI